MNKFKSFFCKIRDYLKKQNNVFLIRLIVISLMFIKTIMFLFLIEGSIEAVLNLGFSIIYLAFIIFVFSFGYLFSRNNQIRFYLIVDFLYTLLLIVDLWYFRVNYDFIGLKNIFYRETFNPMNESLINFQLIDLMFIIDIPIIICWLKTKKIEIKERRNFKKFWGTISASIVSLYICFIFIDNLGIAGWDIRMFQKVWSPLMSIKASGPIGYHGYEAITTLSRINKKMNNKDKEAIENWLSYNKENIEDNEYKGIFKGRNVIFLQLESFENFIINRTANGKEITPFLNKLMREGYYFDNIYEQNNAGNSIDCDLMVNTSIFPLGDKITALNYGENVYTNSLSKILKKEGYTNISTHAEEPASFYWTELHKNGFGADELWSINDYVYDEKVGYGLSDRSFLSQVADKLEKVKEPFFISIPTLSSHGPFDIDNNYRELNLPKEIDESYLGGYFESVHYTDRQVEMFFNRLKENNLLDNTLIVIYGDHGGVHKYYNEDIETLTFEGDWWKEYTYEIPLIIYSPGITPKLFSAHGGQTDILPTVAYLLGIDNNEYRNTSMGRILVNTNRDATVIRDNLIKGNVSSDKEREHILNAYNIGDKIIKNNYFIKK